MDTRGLFRNRYHLTGRDWIRRIDPEDRAVLIRIGLSAMEYGRKGGAARAASARRDERGRFTRSEK